MSIRQKLLAAISRDPKDTTELTQELNLERKVIQDNISGAIKEGLAERKIEDGKPIYYITSKGRERLGNPNSKIHAERPTGGAAAQPEVAQNTGSSAPEPSIIPSGGAAPILYTAETAAITQELANATDLIAELRNTIAQRDETIQALRTQCSRLRDIDQSFPITIDQIVTQIRSIIGSDFGIFFEDDKIGILDLEADEEYAVQTDDIYSLIEALRFIKERKAA